MKKKWCSVFIGFSIAWTLSHPVDLLASTQEEPPRSRIVEAKTFEDLEEYLKDLLPTDALGWDCDNTWALISYPELPGFFDFESCREFKHLWQEAGDAAASEGLYQGRTKDFGTHCFDLLQRKNRLEDHVLLESRMLEIHKKALSQECDSFVCTGLSPNDEKVDFLKRSGFDLSCHYKRTDHVNNLFASSRISSFPGWLYAPGNKAHSMTVYMQKRNLDRQSMLKPPLTRLFYVDNDLGTLDKIDAGFNIGGVELVLIHWRVHALWMEEKHRSGLLIPQIVDGYRILTKPIEQVMGFGPQRSSDLPSTLASSSGFVGLSLSSLSYTDYDSEDECTPLSGCAPSMQQNLGGSSSTPRKGFEADSADNSGQESDGPQVHDGLLKQEGAL